MVRPFPRDRFIATLLTGTGAGEWRLPHSTILGVILRASHDEQLSLHGIRDESERRGPFRMNADQGTLQGLVRALERFPARKALGVQVTIGVHWWTYRELSSAVQCAAARLDELGLAFGDHLLIWGKNSPEWVAWLLACFWRGVVAVPIDDDLSEAYLRSVAAVTAPKLLLCDAHHSAASVDLPVRLLTNLGPAPQRPIAAEGRVTAMHPAAVIFTSGTMSTPRGVSLSHGNIVAQLARFRRFRWLLRLFPVRMLGIAPLSHVQGLIVDVCIPLSLGICVLYVQDVNAAHLMRTIRTYRVHLLATVPRVLQVLTRAVKGLPARDGRRRLGALALLRPWAYRRHVLFGELNHLFGANFLVIVVGGARLAEDDERFWRDAGKIVIQGYGMTETAAIATVTNPYFRPLGSIGKLPQDGSIRVDQDGELMIRGDTVAAEIIVANGRSATAQHGYLKTGDLVRVGKGGHLFFLGRKDDLIVTSEGFNVFAAEVERELALHPAVRDSVVCGTDLNGHRVVHAVLLLEPGAAAEAIVQSTNTRLERHQTIRSWSVWPGPDLPRGALLKVRRGEVIASLSAPVSAAARSETPDEIPQSLSRAIALLDADASAGDEQLDFSRDLGLSSLDMVEFVTLLERRHGVVLDHLALAENMTVASVRRELSSPVARSESRAALQSASFGSGPVARGLQLVLRPVLSWLLFRSRHRVAFIGREHLSNLQAPFVIAAAPHRHWLDVFAVSEALPDRLRRRLLSITNYDFRSPRAGASWRTLWQSFVVAIARHLIAFGLFPVTFLPHRGNTRQGLFELASLMDRGFVPLSFPKGFHFGAMDATRHDAGTTGLSADFRMPVVPIWIAGNDQFNDRRRFTRSKVTVIIGEPVREQTASEQIAAIEARFVLLERIAESQTAG